MGELFAPADREALHKATFKGAVSRYSVIFCAFLREQKMAFARASVADIRPESLTVRAAWQPGHLRWLLT